MTTTWLYLVGDDTHGPFSSKEEARTHAMIKFPPGTEYRLMSQRPGHTGPESTDGEVYRTPGR